MLTSLSTVYVKLIASDSAMCNHLSSPAYDLKMLVHSEILVPEIKIEMYFYVVKIIELFNCSVLVCIDESIWIYK